MHTFFQISFAFAAVHSFTITTASPIESKGTFSFVQKLSTVRNPPAAYARGNSYSKHLPHGSAGETQGSVIAANNPPHNLAGGAGSVPAANNPVPHDLPGGGGSVTPTNNPLPHELAGAAGSVTATAVDAFDKEYTCPVTIGGQTLNLVFDTGSADL
jgi:hypothetical protein